MNQQQKEVQQALLNNEKEVLEALKKNYEEALLEINSNLRYLMNREDADMQHVIYQAEYQKALKDQIEGILNQLNNNEFKTVSEYLTHCYEEGFVGTMYDLQSQGIPLIFPIDQEKVVQAIQHDTKLSTNLYAAFDMKDLKKKISGEISRGISSAVTYNEIARNISGHANVNLNNAMRIARTEGHRINIKSAMDAQQKAREKGADIVKQWDASLDGKTRPHHRELDGQIRELDEDFQYSGGTVSAPAYFGDPSEDCNCRCALLQRARWALGNDITKYSPDAVEEISDDGATKLYHIKAQDYDDFKKKYWKMAESDSVRSNAQKIKPEKTTKDVAKEEDAKYNERLQKELEAFQKAIKSGELTPLADFELYQEISKEIDKKLVGTETSNGIKVTGKSFHYIARTIGSVEQKRNGVSPDSALKIITKPDEVSEVNKKNGSGQKFIKYGVGTVTINPDTGNLIQVNPLKSR